LTVDVHDEPRKTERTFNYRLLDHRLYAPRMAATALVESCSAGDRSEGEQTATIDYTIETDDGRTIKQHHYVSGTLAPQALGSGLLGDLAPIYSNEFQVRSIRRIAADVHLRDGIERAVLSSAHVDRSIARPGQRLRISAYIKPWREPQRRVVITLPIPADVADGPYNVVVADARQRTAAEVSRAPGLYDPKSFADLVRIIDIQFPSNRLYALLTAPDRGFTIDGQEFADLPPSIVQTLGKLNDREKIRPTVGRIEAEATLELPYVVTGSHLTQIQVDRRGGR
jgi:hypothetical protein